MARHMIRFQDRCRANGQARGRVGASIPRRPSLLAGCLALALAGCASAPSPDAAGAPSASDARQAERLVRAAQAMRGMNDDGRAARLALRAAEAAPGRTDLWLYAAALAERAGDRDGADRARGTAALLGSRDPEALLALGRLRLGEGRFEEAARAFAAAAERLPADDPRGPLGRGVALDRMGRHADARRLYGAILARAPDSAAARSNLGLSLILSGQAGQGLGMLRALAARDPAYARNLAEAETLAEALAGAPGTGSVEISRSPVPAR